MGNDNTNQPYSNRKRDMVECRHCYAQIDKRAKICPYCRKPQKKSHIVAIIFMIILLVIAAVLAVIVLKLYSRHKLMENSRTMDETEYKQYCKEVTYDDLMRDEDAMKGQDVTFTGEIIQAAGRYTYRLAIDNPDKLINADAVLLRVVSEEKIIEGDRITVYGTSVGFTSYTGVLGNTVTVPYIYVAYYDVEEVIPMPTNETQSITEEATAAEIQVQITAGESNEYAESLTLNAGTEFEETQYVYYLPAGRYDVTNLSETTEQISLYSRETHVTEEGWEEPAESIFSAVLDAGETTEMIIGDDQYIEIHEPAIIEVKSK